MESTTTMEKAKIDVQLQIFSQQMAYQRERDLRMHETSVWVNKNAWVALEKQGDMVKCLSELTSVIGKGMGVFFGPRCENVDSSVLSTNDQGGIHLLDHGFQSHMCL